MTTHCPTCVFPIDQTLSLLPITGSAPLSSIYALRVFPPTGGAPESRVLAAMERVLQLRENFDNGIAETPNPDGSYSALNITVCNMSLGGPTLFAGQDLESEMTEAFLAKDIVLVVAAGNAGPSGSTVGSPGTGRDALTVGATSSAVHERILRDLQFGLGLGVLFRPFAGVQTAYFSSRGPNADGRTDPDIMANGFASLGQGMGATVNSLDLASGTSAATPSVVRGCGRASSGSAERDGAPGPKRDHARRQPGVDCRRILEANDRGWGHVDAGKALELLRSGLVPDVAGLPGLGSPSVQLNVLLAGIVSTRGTVTRRATNLKPGQRFETYYVVGKDTSSVTITVSDVVTGATPNVLFGDDILLTVHSAKTSSIPVGDGEGDYKVFAFTSGDTFTISNPDLGLMRVTLSGDWTNGSPISASVAISSERTKTPGKSAQHRIQEGETFAYSFVVPPGTARLDAQLEWDKDWGSYPTNDLDLFLIPPSGPPNFDGSSLNVPELAGIDNPVAGTWIAIVDGFSISSRRGDKFGLRLVADGKVIKVIKVK